MSRKLTHEEFLSKLFSVKSDDFTVLGTYHGAQEKIEFKHNLCGTVFSATPNNMLKQSYGGCPICGHTNRVYSKRLAGFKSLDEIERVVKERYGNDYRIIREKSKYVNNKMSTIFLKCNKCNHEFPISYVNILSKKGCPECFKHSTKSKPVLLIEKILQENKFNFGEEFKINECKNIRPLPFDFVVYKDSKIFLIEYDGEFHSRGYNSNKEALKRVVKNDNIKTDYCLKHNIPLLRLNHSDIKNLNNLILNFLSSETKHV